MGVKNTKASQPKVDNPKTFSLIWLDDQVNKTEDNRQTQRKLREIISHLRTFDDQMQCKKYILSLSSQDPLVLIVNGRYGRQLVPDIHQLPQISSIYVYCMDKEKNEQWAKNFFKVKSVVVKLVDLVNQIKSDQQSRLKVEESLPINIFHAKDNSDQSTTGLNGHFVHSLLLIDVFLRIKPTETDKQELIKLCKNESKNNTELALVREFEKKYSADEALQWYTRDSFLYRMLNKALREQNIDSLLLFRFVIGDIYRQMKQYQCRSCVRVYRGQEMSKGELDTLRDSTGELISINSFFSTSTDRNTALKFSPCKYGNSNGLERVLFDIDADPAVVTSKPFADIRSISEFFNECEVLFMIGCIFHLVDVQRDNNKQIWIVKMRLCNDNEHHLKNLFDHMKEQYGGGDGEATLLSLGNVLRQMGKYELAEQMYDRVLDKLPSNDPSLFDLYWSLGLLTKDQGDYDASLQWFHKSLELRQRTNRFDYLNIGNLYNSIGEAHRRKGDQTRALEYYKKAIELFQNEHDENNESMAYFYNNIAIIYDDMEEYSEALDYYGKSLEIKEKHLPPNHPTVATSYSNIGCVYYNLRQYDRAMSYHERSLKINRKALPSQHPDIAICYKNIGLVHEGKRDWKQALKYYQQAATIYHHVLLSDHPDVIQIEKDIKRVS